MNIKLKNGSEITTVNPEHVVRGTIRYYAWEWNDENKEYVAKLIMKETPNCDHLLQVCTGTELKWYQKLWLRIMNFRKEN